MAIESERRLAEVEVNGLLRQYRLTRDPGIRDRIVMQYTNLVESVARRFAGSSEPAEDLTQEGFIGLITAVDGYDAGKGVKFSTYATHFVIGQIKHYLRDRGKIIKEPAWLQELNQRVSRVMEALSHELGRPPTEREVADLMGMTEEAITDLLTSREVFKVASLDGGTDGDDDSPATYDIERVKTGRRDEFHLPVEDRVVLQTALQKLKDLAQAVIHAFYFHEHNQTEIARTLGISCNYVSHILRNSTKKLRRILVTDDLKEAQKEVALLRRRMEEQATVIRDQTVVDPTTRLYNRRYLDNRLDEEVSRASRHQHAVAVVMVELEGHDQIARACGTLRAEDSLRGAAELIRNSVRRVDIVTRFDECTFALILPHTGPQVAVVASRLEAVLGQWIEDRGLAEGRVPVSLRIGYASFPEDASSARDLVLRACEAACARAAPLAVGQAA